MRAFLALLLVVCCAFAPTGKVVRLERSEIRFTSDAPLERITASTAEATGLLDLDQRTFAVKIPVRSFQGFNSPLQREHFIENYMECDDFPNATFQGRIIEALDLTAPGTHEVRAKGRFSLHGVEQERIIPCTVVVAAKGIRVTATFDVVLADHGIRVPRVVQQKLAGTVQVVTDLLFRTAPAAP
ncbi:MAG TPA: YceI family protein [Flavobacteriales bacterium]|jgi:polyisoprenoid-binding protein YceI|nr:YceI family protein [Flavobacteriales bacterium]